MTTRSKATLLKQLWSLVPSGGALPENVWQARFRFLVGLTWFHAIIIALIGPAFGYRWELSLHALFDDDTVLHLLLEAAIPGGLALLATWRRPGRTFQTTAVGFGLLSASAIFVHLSGGYIEAHFHFFVMLTFLALLQDWIPYLLAVAFVALHHGVVGVLWPESVYNHQDAYGSPWTWAGIHAGFVLWCCVGSVIAWRFNERASAQTTLILQASGEGIFGLDTEGKISFINPAAAGMLGVAAGTAIGERFGLFVRQLGADGQPMSDEQTPFLAPLRDGKACQGIDQTFARRDGSYFPVDYVSTPMIEREQLHGVVVSFSDITERHRSEAALQRSHRQLEETLAELKATQQQVLQQERLRAMGQMASGIAHDFNNTLAPILGFGELLQRYPDMPRDTVDKYVRLINTAARDAASVVRRLRELYRERDDSADAAVDLRRCVEEAVALTQPRWRSQALGLGIAIDVETDVADVPAILGDAAAIREMLTNLIFNAVDAMPNGGTIRVRGFVEGGEVHLEVSDTGTGMSDEVRRRCLEPFFSTKGPHGTGLGLALVHSIIERHRGTLTVESAPAKGSTFTVRLPIDTTPAVTVVVEPAVEWSRRLRILLVEDDPLVRLSVTAQLSNQGHTVESAANGLEGLDKFMAGRFDVVITDRAMPEMGGDQLAVTIKRVAAQQPIIMLTGFGDLMGAKGEQPSGVDIVIGKPISLDELTRALEQVTAPR